MDAIGIATLCLSIVCCIIVFICLVFNWKIKNVSLYWIICLFGAVILVAMNSRDIGNILGALIQNSSINPLKILVFFLCMTILSITLDNLGFFGYIANKCADMAGNSQYKLFIVFYLIVSILTVFTSNDIVILSFVPFICYFCKSSKINPAPYVFSTFVAANTWSMMFIIGNPTNVYVSTFAGIDFVSYFLTMGLPTMACGVVSFFVLLILFRKQLSRQIENVNENEAKINKPLVVMNVVILLSCTVLLAISSYVGLEMWYIALGFAIFEIIINVFVCLVTRQKMNYIGNSLKRAPWQFVPFLLSMFLIVMCLDSNGITRMIGEFFAKGNSYLLYGVSSFFFSNIINNIPMTELFSSILSSGSYSLKSAYAVIVGSNLGALLTPVGALAGIMFINILKEKNIDFKVKDFIKYGVIVSVISLATALGVLYLL